MSLVIILLFSVVLLSACSGSADEALLEQKSRVSVDLSTFQVEVENMGRGSRAALSSAASRLSFAVLKSDGTQVFTVHQNSVDEDFGSVEMELYPDTYQMVALAHNGDADAGITSTSSVTLPGTTYTDTFSKVQELTVKSGEDCNLDMTLPRITSAFILKLTDTPPANAKRIEIVLYNGGPTPNPLTVNPSTGFAAENWSQTCSIPIEDMIDDTPDLIYYIGNTSPLYVTVKATAYDSDNNKIIHHIIPSVPLTPNQKTIATGTFFQSSASGIFTITSDWNSEDNNIEY